MMNKIINQDLEKMTDWNQTFPRGQKYCKLQDLEDIIPKYSVQTLIRLKTKKAKMHLVAIWNLNWVHIEQYGNNTKFPRSNIGVVVITKLCIYFKRVTYNI